MSSIKNNISRLSMHEHSGSLHDLLAVIGGSLTACSLMTPWDQVACVSAEANGPEARDRAKCLMDTFYYSGVPMTWSGEVRGAYLRHEPNGVPRYEGTKPSHFVGADLGLVDLARHMRDNQLIVVGVGSAQSPLGWLTYADFSKRPFRVLLFAIVAEVECLLAHALDTAHPDDSWAALLPSNPASDRDERAELLRRQNEAKGWDVTMPLTTFADIGHLVRVIPQSPATLALLGETPDIANQLLAVADLRNRVAHVVRPVIQGPKQIGVVANQIDMLFAWINRWSSQLAPNNDAGGTP